LMSSLHDEQILVNTLIELEVSLSL
jgi:hypothetical protein